MVSDKCPLSTGHSHCQWLGIVEVMVLNVTFNNISVISWQLVLLVEETGVPGENHQTVESHWQTLSHNIVSSTPRLPPAGFQLTTLVVIGTDCTSSCNSNYHTIWNSNKPYSQTIFQRLGPLNIIVFDALDLNVNTLVLFDLWSLVNDL